LDAGAAPFYIGIQIRMVLGMVIAASSAAVLVLGLPGVRPVVAITVTPYFGYFPYRIAAAARLSDTRADRHPSPLIARTLLKQANPKAYASTAVLFLGLVLIGGAALVDAWAKLVTLVVIIGTLDMEWLFAAAVLTRTFRDPVRNRAMNVVFAALLAVSVLFAFVI
jgi:threonine/homoserine/homoserine lactone efflux protein